MNDKWTVPRLAAQAGVTQAWIKILLKRGKIPGYKIGRDWVIEDKDVQAWLAARVANPPQPGRRWKDKDRKK